MVTHLVRVLSLLISYAYIDLPLFTFVFLCFPVLYCTVLCYAVLSFPNLGCHLVAGKESERI